jgi:hypothetical protein
MPLDHGCLHVLRLARVSGLVVEWLPATESARVRFSANAFFANLGTTHSAQMSRQLPELVTGTQSRVAQWSARWAHNPQVVGSKPTSATFVCDKSLSGRNRTSDPVIAHNYSHMLYQLSYAEGCKTSPASIAQLGERQTEDLKVLGSIPSGGTFSELQWPSG